MATLHMDVDQVTAAKSQLNAARDQVEQQVTTLKTMVDNMVGSTWIAPGANSFQGEFGQWQGSMTQALARLQELVTKLDSEINEWVQTAGA